MSGVGTGDRAANVVYGPRPLTGVRVLDLSRLLPGPFATLWLSDYGAEVDKLEDPGAGDYLRAMPPYLDGTGVAFEWLNRGKRSAVVDLKHAEGRACFERLVGTYDVLVESFRPGVMERLGVGHATLLAMHPRLIVAAISGFGQDGPDASRAGHDLNFLARSGVLGVAGPHDAPPAVPPIQIADVTTGLAAAFAITAALHARAATGCGRVLDLSMTEVSLTLGAISLAGAFVGAAPLRGEDTLTGGIAPYGVYRTRDGRYVALAALEPKFWDAFCRVADIEPDPQALVPGPHQAHWRARIAAIVEERTASEWEGLALSRDLCLEVVRSPSELAGDPQLRHRGALQPVRGTPSALPATPLAEKRPHARAPRHGEHTERVLLDAGFAESEVARLRAVHAIA